MDTCFWNGINSGQAGPAALGRKGHRPPYPPDTHSRPGVRQSPIRTPATNFTPAGVRQRPNHTPRGQFRDSTRFSVPSKCFIVNQLLLGSRLCRQTAAVPGGYQIDSRCRAQRASIFSATASGTSQPPLPFSQLTSGIIADSISVARILSESGLMISSNSRST